MTDNISSLRRMAEEMGGQQRRARDDAGNGPQILPSPNNPMAVARLFLEHCCLHDGIAGELTLRFWQGGWWAWRTTHWVEVEARGVRALLYAFTEHALYCDAEGDFVPWLPTRRKIGDLLEALTGMVLLSNETEQPGWLDHRDIAGPMVATTNGLLDVSTRELYPHTPMFLNITAVPFAYEPNAVEPGRWIEFLNDLWPRPEDAQSQGEEPAIKVLGEWFGYVISGRLDLHKILLTVGPTRGGKGVIARILSALVGERNVAGPTLSSLGSDFGLAPLIGKPLAVISDARLSSGKNDASGSIIVERLLSISGEDRLTVNIKYKEQWNGKLPSRLHILSNELPRLGDASSAVVGRLVLLQLSRSWLGKEDIELEANIRRTDLPGILNWALDGLERLTFDNENRFTSLASADEAITTMRDLASPVGAFVREMCEVGHGRTVETGALYAAYKVWVEDSGHRKLSKHVFGRDLRAAVPSIKITQPGPAGSRTRLYSGLSLREAADAQKPLL